MVLHSNATVSTVSTEAHGTPGDVKSMDEKNLILRIQSGDKDEFRHLVMAYKDLVFSMIMRQVGNHAVSEELAQEVFIKAYSNIKKFQFKSAFSTWLTRIALNHTSTFFTSKRHRMQVMTDEFDVNKHEGISVTDANQKEEQVNQEKLLARFREAVSQLKDIFRQVIVLCSLEGKSYEEAAEILDVPVGTIRSRLNKARLLVKESLER
jgi:RNA polymerase sigma-70 factor (ECF subfamily)